jgi:hypothetical protein
MKTPNDDAAFDPYHLWLQVPKDSRPPTHYQLLGLAVGEKNPEVIRQATLMRSAYVRHFQNGPNAADANRILEELAEASRVLLDDELRTAYEAKVKPPPKPAARPAVVSGSKQVVVAAPPTPVPDYSLADRGDRRPKKKRRSKSRRTLVNSVFGIVVLGAALGVVGYLVNAYVRDPAAALAKSDAKERVELDVDVPKVDVDHDSTEGVKQAEPPPPKKPRSPDALVVRLSVEPADAQLTIEPIGDAKTGGPTAEIEGEGSQRTIVAEKGALPLVVAASATGYQSNRVTVFSSDAGRLVVVQLQRGSDRNLLVEGSRPVQGGKGPSRRLVGPYRPGIPISSKDERPVWKYTVNRPPFDWASTVFSDINWSDGEAAFGTKVGKNALKNTSVWLRTQWGSRDIWLRRRVELPPEIKNASIRWSYRNDDRIQVYVNGVFVFGDDTYNIARSTRVTEAVGFQPGENIVAVHCRNASGPGVVDVGFEWAPTEDAK